MIKNECQLIILNFSAKNSYSSLPVVVVPAHHEEHLGAAGDLLESAVAPRVPHLVPDVILPRLAVHEDEETVLFSDLTNLS